jgi:hypothetical protein
MANKFLSSGLIPVGGCVWVGVLEKVGVRGCVHVRVC